MRIHLTFEFDDEQRLGVARLRKHRRPATRTELIQFVTDTVATQVGGAVAGLRQANQDSDRRQLKPFEPSAPQEAVG